MTKKYSIIIEKDKIKILYDEIIMDGVIHTINIFQKSLDKLKGEVNDD